MLHVIASTGLAHDHPWAVFPIVFGLVGLVVGGSGAAAFAADRRDNEED